MGGEENKLSLLTDGYLNVPPAAAKSRKQARGTNEGRVGWDERKEYILRFGLLGLVNNTFVSA